MRIALISIQSTADDAPDLALGGFSLGGRSVADRQLDFALALGCERVVCLAAGVGPQALALQHRAEAAGVQFNLITGAHQLLGLVSARDELVAIADGLLLAPDETQTALAGGAGVLVFPVEAGTASGLERIDLNHAWAGVVAMPGRLVEHLAELPRDCDPVSGLLRIALQGRVPKRVLPEALLAEGRWALIRTRHQLADLEPGWFRRHAAAPDWRAPGRALARVAVRNWGGRLLDRGFRPVFLVDLGLLLAGAGAVGAWFGWIVTGVAVFAAGSLIVEGGLVLAGLARAGMGGEGQSPRLAEISGIVRDLVLVTILALSLAGAWPERLFAPLVLVGLLRIGARSLASRWAGLLEDRTVLATMLAAAAIPGLLLPAVEALALALLALLLGLSRGTARLTQT